MANPNGYSKDSQEEKKDQRKRWYLEKDKEKAARELVQYCASLEDAQQKDRYLGMIFEQLATGRAPSSYALQMDGRIKGDLATALYAPPSENYIAIAIDTFANKIGKNRPFLQWVPLALSDTEVRDGCRQAEDYADQIFEDLKTWPMVSACFKHGSIHGNGPIWVDAEAPSDGVEGKISLVRLNKDECLVDPTADENPINFQVRLFMDRRAVLKRALKGKNKEEADELTDYILNKAPGCKAGFYSLDIGYEDTLALCIGFYCPPGEKSRRLMAIGDRCIEDMEFDGDLPIASFVYEPIAGSWAGQGVVEQMLPLQREVDRIADNLAESERRFCWAKYGFRRDDQIDPDDLVGNSNVEYNEQPPKPIEAPEPPEKLYDQLEKKGQQALARVGISLGQTQGQPEPGINSGVAIIAATQIDDVRHVAVAERLEGLVENLGKLIIQATKIAKPKVYSSGKLIKWPQIVDDQKKCKSRAFKMSGLPQSIPGRKQAIEDMKNNGEIDLVTYRRALGSCDIRPTEDDITEVDNFINYQLDKIVKSGEFDPPMAFIDFKRALSLSQKRLLREIRNEIEESKIQKLAHYSAICAQRVQEMNQQQLAAAQPPVATQAQGQ